ncbi:efflux RND transporter permease subunit [Terrabacter terrae]|uniref:Efflux RND transporter permease subunit n=2 Tax=Terrabacter terrae TaxID=318434 RepID=A0ABN2TU07_9MICO
MSPGALVGANPRFGRLVLAVAAGILVLGAAALGSAKLDFLPEFMPPSVQVQTEALGLSAAEVEQLVTVPLEQDLLNGVPWLDHIHSRSQAGLSAIDILFEPGTDIYAARQMVQERLTQAHALPNVGSPPIMVEPLASASRVAMIGLHSKTVPLIDMSVLARWKIRPRLMGIPGVANVSIYGQRDRQLQVQVDPVTLHRQGVTLTQVIETTGNALWVSPLTFVEASTPGTGGFVEGANQRLAVQHVLPITTAKNLAQVSIEDTEPPKRLSDVAQVIEDHQPLIGDAVTAEPSLFLVIQKFPEADTETVTKAVEDALTGLRPGLGGIEVDASVYRPASFIESAAHTVGLAGAAGLVALTIGALLLFWSLRAALVIAGSVLVSVTATLYILYLRGTTLTSMTLAGLLVAVVLIVNEVASDVDTVRAGWRAERSAGVGRPAREVLTDALGATRRTAFVGLLACAMAAVPVLALSTLATAFTRPLVLTYVLALAVALVVGLTVTPALLLLFLRDNAPGRRETRPVRAAAGVLSRIVSRVATTRVLVWSLAAGLAVVGVGVAAAAVVTGSPALVPTARDLDLLMHVDMPTGTSLTEMTRVSERMSSELRALPGVTAVGGHVGRAVSSDQLGDVNSGELWLTLDGSADYQSVRDSINRVAHRYPGVGTALMTYTTDRVDQATAAGAHDIVVRLFGQDLTAMQATATKVAGAMSTVAGLQGAHVVATPRQPTVHVEVNLAAADRAGLRPGDVRREATTLASGLVVGNLYEQAKVFDVVVLGTPTTRANLSGLEDVRIDTPSGSQVRLGDVAKVTVGPEPATIVHDQAVRSVDVVADLTGGGAANVVSDVTTAVDRIPMPSETHLQVLSDAADREADGRRVALVSLAVLVGLLLLVQAATGSWRAAAAVVLLAPLGGVGAVLVAPAVGGLESAGPMLGVFAAIALTLVGGLASARGIGARVLVTAGDGVGLGTGLGTGAGTGRGDGAGEVARPRVGPVAAAAGERVVPVLRSALLVALAMAPAAVLGDRAGSEVLQPFAVSLLAGLVTSSFVVLCLVPALCGVPKGAQR